MSVTDLQKLNVAGGAVSLSAQRQASEVGSPVDCCTAAVLTRLLTVRSEAVLNQLSLSKAANSSTSSLPMPP